MSPKLATSTSQLFCRTSFNMKWESSIILGLAAIADSASIRHETQPPTWPQLSQMFDVLEKVAPNIKPAMILEAVPQLRSNATRKLILFGPYNLPAGKVGIYGNYYSISTTLL